MTKLLKHAMTMMDELPEDLQDTAARQIMQYVEELSTFDDGASLGAFSPANPPHFACR
jgi:hypothetical protein